MSKQKSPPLAAQLTTLTLARLFINTGLRMVYPFLPALARGAGVSLTAVYRIVTLRNFAGLLSPVFSPLSERFGRKPVLIGAALLGSLGCLFVFIWPTYWALGVTLIAIAIAKIIYDPAMQAYVGDTVPYRQRGRAISITETSWAGALLLGAPVIGLILQRWGWQAPFLWLGLFGMVTALLLWRILPRVAHPASRLVSWRSMRIVIRRYPVIWAAAVYTMLAMAANEIIFIVYGDWMEGQFGLSLATLGLASGLIGGTEIVGELFAGFAVDRWGKRPVIITSGLLNAAAYLLIPHFSSSLAITLLMLFFVFVTFEVTIVGGVPLLTELVPAARSVVMSMTLAAAALGRALGSLTGPIIRHRVDFVGNGTAAAAVMLVGVVVLVLWVKEGSRSNEDGAN